LALVWMRGISYAKNKEQPGDGGSSAGSQDVRLRAEVRLFLLLLLLLLWGGAVTVVQR